MDLKRRKRVKPLSEVSADGPQAMERGREGSGEDGKVGLVGKARSVEGEKRMERKRMGGRKD